MWVGCFVSFQLSPRDPPRVMCATCGLTCSPVESFSTSWTDAPNVFCQRWQCLSRFLWFFSSFESRFFCSALFCALPVFSVSHVFVLCLFLVLLHGTDFLDGATKGGGRRRADRVSAADLFGRQSLPDMPNRQGHPWHLFGTGPTCETSPSMRCASINCSASQNV